MNFEKMKNFTKKPEYGSMLYSNAEKPEVGLSMEEKEKIEKNTVPVAENAKKEIIPETKPEISAPLSGAGSASGGKPEEAKKLLKEKELKIADYEKSEEAVREFVKKNWGVEDLPGDFSKWPRSEELKPLFEARDAAKAELAKKDPLYFKEKAENLLRENFVKAQLDFEKVKQAGGYDPEDFKTKKAPFEGKYNEAKKLYYESLNNKEGIAGEQKNSFLLEEIDKLQDIKNNLWSKEETKKAYFPFNTIKNIGNWYKEQPVKQKYIVAAALIGGGIFTAMTGGSALLLGAMGSTALVSRILSGAGTAVALETAIAQGEGKKFGMHWGHKGLMKEKTAQEIEKIKKGDVVGSLADFLEKNEEALATASEKLYKESKNLETQRALISGAMGAVIATGAFTEAIKNVMHWTGADKAMKGAFDWTKEHLGLGGSEKVVASAGLVSQSEIQGSQSAEVQSSALAESEKIRELATIRKGEGVTHVFQRQLEDDPVKFGFTGDVNNSAEVDKWVDQKAYDIAVKEGYIAEKGEAIVSGTQRVLEKDPLHYGFTGDVKNADEVHKWAMKEAGDVASKTGTDLPGTLETRVRWDYSQGPENQATFTLSPDGKVTEAISSLKHPEYLYDSTGVAKTQKGLDLINEQIKANDANIEKLNVDAAKEARRRLATGMGSFHAEKEFNEAIANADVLAAQKNVLEDKLKFQSGISQASSETSHQVSGVSHTEIKGDKLVEKIAHIETQFNKDNAFLLKEIPSELKESLISGSAVDLSRIEPGFDKLDFEQQNNIIKFIAGKTANAYGENIGETAISSEKLHEHLYHSYLKNIAELIKGKVSPKFDVGILEHIKNMSIDDLHKNAKTTMILTKGSSNPHLAYEDLSNLVKKYGFKGGREEVFEVLGKIGTILRNK